MSGLLRVKVKLFGAIASVLQTRDLTLELKSEATGRDLLEMLPIADKSYIYMVRDGIRIGHDTKLNDGDEVLVFPPIAGGSFRS